MHRFAAIVVCGSAAVYSANGLKPLTHPRPLYRETDLLRDNVVQAAIYCPPSSDFQLAARELNAAIKARFGVLLPIRSDDEQRTWRTEKANILVLGNMGNSSLLRILHWRALIAPADKRRLRTVHDPFAGGRNVVMLGGVDIEHVKQNFQPFLDRIQNPAPGTLVLSPTFDPPPGISANDKRRCEQYLEELPRMHTRYAAYHAGWAGARYAATGHEDFARLYRESLLRLAEENYYVHLYLFREFRGWSLIEESPLFSDAERLAIVNFFRDSVADPDEGIASEQYFGVRKNVRSIQTGRLILGNHPSQAACGVMVVADYLRRYYPSELHEEWYREALKFFDIYRNKGCYLGDDEVMQGSSISNIMTAVYRTESNPAAHPFLRNFLTRLIPNYNNFGTFPAYGDDAWPSHFAADWFAQGARLYGNPEFLWMHRFIRTARPDKAATFPTEPSSPDWWSDANANLVPVQPKGFVGLGWAEPDETLFSLAKKEWADANCVSMTDCYGRAAFRGGIDPQDDYLLLDGVHLGHAYDDQNGILEYSSLGRTWLVSCDANYGTPQSAHNVVSTSRDGMADPGMPTLAVRRLWADLPSFAGTRTVLIADGHDHRTPFEHLTSDWERNILWFKNRFFVVFDRIIARTDGMHSAVGFWRMVGERNDLPGGIEMRQHTGGKEATFRLTMHGVDSVVLGREQDPQAGYTLNRRYTANPPAPLDSVPPVIHMLKAHKARVLKTGESFTMAACFRARSEQRPVDVACESIGENVVRIVLDGRPMLAACGPLETGGLRTDAELTLVAADRVCLVTACTLEVAGRTLFKSSEPVSFEWEPTSGRCECVATVATSAHFLDRELSIPVGRSAHSIVSTEAGELLATVTVSLSGTGTPDRKHSPPAGSALAIVAEHSGSSAVKCLWTGQLGNETRDMLVGRCDGVVERLVGPALEPAWIYRCQGPVNSIDAGDTTGGVPRIAVGSDDHQLHVLDLRGEKLWTWTPPFDELKARLAYCQWMWPEPFVKKVAMHDITGDGRAEIVVGGGMNTFGVGDGGTLLWSFDKENDHHPTMTAIAFADVNGDGTDEPIGGTSDMWYSGSPFAIDSQGRKIKSYPGDGWVSGVKAILAEDLEGKGVKALIYGTRANGLRCCPDVRNDDSGASWYRKFGDFVAHIATLVSGEGDRSIAVAGGDTQWVTAFDPAGKRLWAVYLDSAVAALSSNTAKDRLYVVCEDGGAHELDAAGNMLRSARLPAKPTVAAAYPGTGIVVGTEAGHVYWLK